MWDKAAYMKEYYKTHKDAMNAATVKYRHRHLQELRREVIEHYGAVCACCGEDKYEFLSIDHINGGGTKHRKEIGGGYRLPEWLIKNNYPDGFRVLCYNCNLAKGFLGYCPHENLMVPVEYVPY